SVFRQRISRTTVNRDRARARVRMSCLETNNLVFSNGRNRRDSNCITVRRARIVGAHISLLLNARLGRYSAVWIYRSHARPGAGLHIARDGGTIARLKLSLHVWPRQIYARALSKRQRSRDEQHSKTKSFHWLPQKR